MSRLYNIILLVTCFAITVPALAHEDPVVEKKKQYSKSYSLSGNDLVSLANQFGQLKINTWNKNEVKVDVTITAEAGNDERAQRILDNITISDGKNGDGVYFKTSTKGNNKGSRVQSNEKTSFRVDYEVYLPAGNPISATNEFGSTSIGDHNGEATIISRFGSVKAGKLSNAKRVEIEFGSMVLESMNNGKLIIKFSSVEVRNTSGSLDVVVEHSSAKLNLDNDVKDIKVKNSFSPLILDVPTNFNASFDIHTSFAKLKNKTSFAINKEGEEKDRGPKFDFDYSGKSGNGATPVKVRTEFGDVTIGHNVPFKVDDKKKNTKDI
ncbi:MAG: hypothetical protein ACTHMC_15490 [Pseudobacter sp.]|uniref:hypothetical protein n=1 Tax=Pseudobacter sp. TaxID=2045420 RepID=UPI003F7ED249